jgi:hypothetical protein
VPQARHGENKGGNAATNPKQVIFRGSPNAEILFFYGYERGNGEHRYYRHIVVASEEKDDRISTQAKKGHIMRASSERQVATDGTGISCLSNRPGPSHIG